MHDTMGSTEEKPSKTLEFQQIIEPQNGALVVFTETFESATKFLQWVQIFATGNKRRKKAKAMESSEFCLNFPGELSYSNTFEQVSSLSHEKSNMSALRWLDFQPFCKFWNQNSEIRFFGA